MAVQVIRFTKNGETRWGVHRDGQITPLSGNYPTTRDFFTQGGAEEALDCDKGADSISLGRMFSGSSLQASIRIGVSVPLPFSGSALQMQVLSFWIFS